MLVFKDDKKITTIPPLIQSWNLSRRLNGSFINTFHISAHFLSIHICIGHIAIKIYMLMSHTHTPGYSLLFLVCYTQIWAYSNVNDNQFPHHKIYILVIYMKKYCLTKSETIYIFHQNIIVVIYSRHCFKGLVKLVFDIYLVVFFNL